MCTSNRYEILFCQRHSKYLCKSSSALTMLDFAEPYIYTGAPSILLSIMTITLDLFVIKFYWKRELTVVSLLYSIIASLDVLTAIGVIYLHVTILLYELYEKEFISDRIDVANAVISTFFLQVGYRCSVFSNLVLAVSRTIMILKPFYQIDIKKVKVACILYAVPWIVLFGLDAHLLYSRDYDVGNIMHNEYNLLIGKRVAFEIYDFRMIYDILLMLPILVAFLIPVIIVIITCIIQVVTLRRSSQFPTSSNQRHVTITVLLMSTLFVICNSPLTSYLVGGYIIYIFHYYSILVIFATVLPILNAAFNPVIIITRSSGMRRKFSDSFQGMLRWVRQG